MLFNEPKLLKCGAGVEEHHIVIVGFSALQRAEIAEIYPYQFDGWGVVSFSALQRAEIAEINAGSRIQDVGHRVSVLFNEPKLLK